MAGVVTEERDLANGRVCSMWVEAGIQYRSNLLLRAGAKCPLHAHSFDHMTFVRHGDFDVIDEAPDGTRRQFEASAGDMFLIPEGHAHSFLLKTYDGKPGNVVCIVGPA